MESQLAYHQNPTACYFLRARNQNTRRSLERLSEGQTSSPSNDRPMVQDRKRARPEKDVEWRGASRCALRRRKSVLETLKHWYRERNRYAAEAVLSAGQLPANPERIRVYISVLPTHPDCRLPDCRCRRAAAAFEFPIAPDPRRPARHNAEPPQQRLCQQ